MTMPVWTDEINIQNSCFGQLLPNILTMINICFNFKDFFKLEDTVNNLFHSCFVFVCMLAAPGGGGGGSGGVGECEDDSVCDIPPPPPASQLQGEYI